MFVADYQGDQPTVLRKNDRAEWMVGIWRTNKQANNRTQENDGVSQGVKVTYRA